MASAEIDRVNSKRQGQGMTLQVSLTDVPDGDQMVRVTVLVNGLEVNTPYVMVEVHQ